MKCLVFLVAVGLLAVMVAYSSASTSVVATPSGAVASVSASQTANTSSTAPSTTTEPATTASLGVNVLPSALIMSVAILVAALQ